VDPFDAVECRATDEDLTGGGGTADAGRLVDTLTLVIAAFVGRLGGVDTDAHLGSETVIPPVGRQGLLDRHGAGDRRLRPREGDEEAVPEAVDDIPAVTPAGRSVGDERPPAGEQDPVSVRTSRPRKDPGGISSDA
jgi:hypothetical protein